MMVTPRRNQSRWDECSVDYVEGFLETMVWKRVMRRHGNATRNAALEKLITPHAKTEWPVRSLGRPVPDISQCLG
jgi:hypothetical protein